MEGSKCFIIPRGIWEYFFVVLLFSILTVSTANAEENKDTNVEEQNQSVVSSESNIVLNDYMKIGYFLEA